MSSDSVFVSPGSKSVALIILLCAVEPAIGKSRCEAPAHSYRDANVCVREVHPKV